MKLDEVSALLTPANLPYVSGLTRLPDGVLHVAVLTRMPEVSPEMMGWWFGEYLQTTEHYKRWHPRDHVWMKWEDKKPGTHVGAKHLVHESIGGRLRKLRIAFAPPEDFFQNALAGVPGAVAVCGRVGLLDRPIDVGHLVHLALPCDSGCELHSRFWLGHVASRSRATALDTIANQPWVRRRLASRTFGRALAVHCREEMSTLAGFLPELYATEARATKSVRAALERGLLGKVT